MNKEEFIRQLETELSGMPENEKQEALQYYRDYFEDAGGDKEAEVLKSLGTPAEVARTIMEEGGNGDYTENGYHESTANGSYMAQSAPAVRGAAGTSETNDRAETGAWQDRTTAQDSGKKMDTAMIVLIIVGVLLTSPIWIPILGGIISTVVGIVAAMIGIGIAGPFLVIGCIAIVIGSLAALASGLPGPIVLMLIGIGLIIGAIGVLFILFAVIGCYYFIPWAIKMIKKLWNKLFPQKEAAL